MSRPLADVTAGMALSALLTTGLASVSPSITPTAVRSADVSKTSPALTLAVSGARLTVAGTPRFLVFVSYFDAMDAAFLDTDLAWIADRADGIRVFVNWWDFDDRRRCATRFSDRTLMRVNAEGAVSVSPERLDRLKAVLAAARSHGLVVDLTFSYESVTGLSKLEGTADGDVCGSSSSVQNQVRLEPYVRAVGEVAKAVSDLAFDHVLIDVQNEINGGWGRLTPDEVAALASAVHHNAPGRPVTASSFDPDPARQLRTLQHARLDVLTFHDWPRNKAWPERTGQQVTAFRLALAKAGLELPIFAGEPDRSTYGRGASAFSISMQGAERAGAAAWTLHTRAGFRLDTRRFSDALDPAARQFLDERARRPPPGPAPPAR